MGRIIAKKNVDGSSSLPEIGRIKIGMTSDKGCPVSLDYFRATGSMADRFNKVIGERPKSLKIAFISNDLSEVCNERFESWDKGRRFGWGDGVEFNVWNGVEYEVMDKSDARVRALKWDRMLTLRFVLLDLKGIYGYWTFETKADKVTIPSIIKTFDMIKDKTTSIIGLPFELIVEKAKSYNPGAPRTYPVVKLVPNFSDEMMGTVRDYLESGGDVNRINPHKLMELDSNPKIELK